jgi:Icc protein
MALKIAQITDLHLAPGERKVHGMNPKKNLLLVLNSVKNFNPDIIALTGDVLHDEMDDEIYPWLKEQVDQCGSEVYIIPGNHDEVDSIKTYFNLPIPQGRGEIYYHIDHKEVVLAFLDTSTRVVSQEQLEWLTKLCKDTEKEIILFMHHPPVLSGCRFMDTHFPLKNRKEVQDVLKQCVNIRHIFCGHYHTGKKIAWQDKFIYITASTIFQIDEDAEGLELETHRIGWRTIEIREDGLYSSQVQLALSEGNEKIVFSPYTV